MFCDFTPDTGAARIRRMFSLSGHLFVVVGNRVAEVLSNGTYSMYAGTVIDDGLPAIIAGNPDELFIESGRNGYVIRSAALNPIVDPAFPTGRARGAGMIGGYFVTGIDGTQQFAISDINNGLTWPGDESSAEDKPDFISMVGVLNQELWPFGDQTIQVFDNTGDLDFPLEPRLDVSVELGIWAPYSLTNVGGSWYFVAGSERGVSVVVRMSGYQPARVSDHSTENTLRSLSNPSDWVGWTYEENGHAFYVIYSPSADRTLCYDASVDKWHERTWLNPATGEEEAHRGYCAAQAFGKILVGDRADGKIYEQSMDLLNDGSATQLIRRTRISPCIDEELLGITHDNFVLDGNMGIGTGGTSNTDPQAVLQFSNDGGKTWSNEKWRGFGRQGQYGRRAIWRRLGYARRRVYKLVVTDAVDWAISGCYVNMRLGK